MAGDAAPQGGSAPDLKAVVQIEATQASSPALRNCGNSGRAATLIPVSCPGSKMLLSPEFRLFGQRGHDFTGGDYLMREGRTVALGSVQGNRCTDLPEGVPSSLWRKINEASYSETV